MNTYTRLTLEDREEISRGLCPGVNKLVVNWVLSFLLFVACVLLSIFFKWFSAVRFLILCVHI